jgi:8-oxo-dGTP pyrophosphatase MutT (NUDIX family)
MAPVPRRTWPTHLNPARIRNAAGLLLLFPAAGAKNVRDAQNADDPAHIVLTVRSDTLERHGGQVSLPGGVVDPGETFEQAALREAHEEIALTIDEIEVLGTLTPLDIPVSGFRLHPIVAATSARPAMSPADGEVARILEIDLDDLLRPSCVVRTTRDRNGVAVVAPAFRAGGVDIWGATAMVLAEFLALLGWPAPETN